MRKILIILISIWAASHLAAHNARIATINLSIVDGEWVMQMSFAQAGLDEEILKVYSEEELREMDPSELKQWFANYVRDNIAVWSDGKKLAIGAGGILLGNHQTDMKFSIPEMPIFPEDMSFRISMCEEARNQTNILRIFQGDEMTKFFLSSDNDFRADVRFDGIEILEVGSQESVEAKLSWEWSALLLILPAAFFLRNRLTPKFEA